MMQMYLGCSRLQKKIVKSVANSCVVVFMFSAFMRWAVWVGGGLKKQRPHSLCFSITVLFHTGLLNLAGGLCLPSHSPSEQGGTSGGVGHVCVLFLLRGSSVLIQKSLHWNPLLQTVPRIESFTVRNDNTLRKNKKGCAEY